MVTRRRGIVLLELVGVFVIVALLTLSAAAVLRAQAANVRTLYEERLAEEAAAAVMERREAAGWSGLKEGRTEVKVEFPGWENLPGAACAWTVGEAEEGVRIVEVEVAWDGYRGGRRSVRLRTRIGGLP